MNKQLAIYTSLLLAAFCHTSAAQTANVNNNVEAFYMGDGSTLLNSNAEYYLGTFGSLNDGNIAALFGSDSSANYNALFSSFSVLGSIRNPNSGGFGFSFAPEANEYSVPFNGNVQPSFFHGKAMQVVVLGSVDGQNSPGNLLQIGIYNAYDFDNNSRINFVTSDAFDINDFGFAGFDSMGSDTVKVGARAILGTGGDTGTRFALSTTTVPEPSSTTLMVLGVASLLAMRRFRKNI
jgi:hypothetical protein